MAVDIRKVELVGQGETRGIRACNVLGDLIYGKVAATDTNGAFSMVEEVVPPGGGTPPHVHSREDEVFYVLEGECEFWTREGTVRAKAGETVHAPRNIPHCFRNVSDHPARMLTLIHPAGMEQMFEDLDALAAAGEPSIPDVIEVCAGYGITILPPDEARP